MIKSKKLVFGAVSIFTAIGPIYAGINVVQMKRIGEGEGLFIG